MRYHELRRTLGTRFQHGSRHNTTNSMRHDPHPPRGFLFGGDHRQILPMLRTILPLLRQPSPDPTPLGRLASSPFNYFFQQANQTLLVSGLLPVLALERQLGKLVECKEAAIYVEPNWVRLHRLGYITDRVLPNTTIPCPYLTYMTRVRVQRPTQPHDMPMVNPKDENQSSSSAEQTNTDPPDQPIVLYNYEWNIYQQLYLDEGRYDRIQFKQRLQARWIEQFPPAPTPVPATDEPAYLVTTPTPAPVYGSTFLVHQHRVQTSHAEMLAEAFEVYKEDYVREYNETSTDRFQAFKASFTIVEEPLNVTEEQPHQLRNRIAKDWRIRRLLFFEENEEQRLEREMHELDLQITALRKQLKRGCPVHGESEADMPK
jgi:hypothetical protein